MLIDLATVITNSMSSALKIVPCRHERNRVHRDEKNYSAGGQGKGMRADKKPLCLVPVAATGVCLRN